MKVYLPLIQKDSSTHMHGLADDVKEGLPFGWHFSLENSADSDLCFRLTLLHSASCFFFLYQSRSSSLGTVFDSTLPNLMRFSRSTHLLMFLCLETLTSIMRTGLPIPVELIDLLISVTYFLSQMTLLR